MLRALRLLILLAGVPVMISCGAEEGVAFIAGSAEDEEAIREIISQGEALHYADDVDWENAFGGRFLGREAVARFVTEMVEPTLDSAEGSQRVTVRFLGPDLALADSYWRLVGQAGPHPERVGRNTYLLARNEIEWQILMVRVADLQTDPVPRRTVDEANPWPTVELSEEELAVYEGLYEEESFGGMPVPVRIWVEGGNLRTETRTFGVVDLVPMGNDVFAAGRYVDGELVEIYWPGERQIFQVGDRGAIGFKVVEGTTELSSAERIDQTDL
jgi:ketosteroid isomerase-like protein